jgi:hypothetical protein
VRHVLLGIQRSASPESPPILVITAVATIALGLGIKPFWERVGGAATWTEMYASEGRQEQMTALRKCTYAGRPFGNEAFVAAMEERFRANGGEVRRIFGERSRNVGIK